MLRRLSKKAGNRKGFSLMEAAIVLGIVGVVLSAIWAARGVVAQRQNVDQAIAAVHETAENVRALYTGQQNSVFATGQAQVCAGLFPRAFLQGSGTYDCNTWVPRNPWQGDVRLGFSPATARPRGVSVALLGPGRETLPSAVCVDMLDRMQGVDHRTTRGGASVSNNVPVPSSPPEYETAQGGQPTNVYVSPGSGTWLEATGRERAWVLQQVGSNSCFGVAFFFEF